ncbi:MAG: pyridoxine 5'-phosphate synthase [Deltaproteobacteria bacterium]|nr:pyridoxine 5'-phosphate synthase [Deltaproteobacteria bacterium]
MRLHVNIDHVATIRQARGESYPDPVWAASLCELSGAHGITAHLREDRRHISDRDVRILKQTIRTVMNLEMAATDEMVGIACEVRPEIATLVPEKREERTTEGGLDVEKGGGKLAKAVERLMSAGIEVALFIDPEIRQIDASAALKVPRIELHTGDYAHARGASVAKEIDRLTAASRAATARGLHVAAGHGLDYPNVQPVARIPGVRELNIGHAIIARAVFVGLERAVRDMLDLFRPPAKASAQ